MSDVISNVFIYVDIYKIAGHKWLFMLCYSTIVTVDGGIKTMKLSGPIT